MTAIKTFTPWSLGSPLYMPAHRLDLLEIANAEKHPALRCVIFCTEDAILQQDVNSSLRYLGLCLQGFRSDVPRYRFIRARNPEILSRLLDLPHIEKIDGFVLPKFNMEVFDSYTDQLRGTHFKIMPTIETREVFDTGAMLELRLALSNPDIFERLLILRIGGNDLMNLLGLRRSNALTIYATPLGQVIAQLITLFKPYGFSLSAPVFEQLANPLLLQQEIELDLAHGLVGKTAIHPEQVPAIEAAYRVTQQDVDMAAQILSHAVPAVFKMHDTMCEVATHTQWAQNILERQQLFGIKDSRLADEYMHYQVS